MTKLLLGILGVMIIVSVGVWFLSSQKSVNKIEPVACTEEAMLCPDGSAVGRTGPNCEFAPCPTVKPKPASVISGYVSGHVTIGPICPVERVGVPCPVPEEAYTSRNAVIYQSDGITVKEKKSLDKNGNYKYTLGPGKYFVQIDPAGIGPGEKKPFTIVSLQTTIVDFDIDTGIR